MTRGVRNMSVDLKIYNTATTNKHLNRLARAVSTCQTGRRPTRQIYAAVTINHRGQVMESVMCPKRRENKETPRRRPLCQICVNTVIITTVVGHYVMTTQPMLMPVNTIQYYIIIYCVARNSRDGTMAVLQLLIFGTKHMLLLCGGGRYLFL